MEIDVIKDGEAFERLKSLSENAICIRAAMAYWTIPADKLPIEFLSGVKSKDGFIYCDMHNPTSIDSLVSLNDQGIKIYLNLLVATGKSEITDSSSMPNHLMHCKLIIFDYNDGSSVIWVGSHNMTFRAMYGLNKELTLAIKTKKTSAFYLGVHEYLGEIIKNVHVFDEKLIDFYRVLQGAKGDKVSVIELQDKSNQSLDLNDTITIFNIGNEDYNSFKTVHKDIFVRIKEPSGDSLWSAEVVQSGETPTKKLQTFSRRNYVDQQDRLLIRQEDVPDYLYAPDTHYTVLEIKSRIPHGWCLVKELNIDWVAVKAECNEELKEIMKEKGIKGLRIKKPQYVELKNNGEDTLTMSRKNLERVTPLIQKMRFQSTKG